MPSQPARQTRESSSESPQQPTTYELDWQGIAEHLAEEQLIPYLHGSRLLREWLNARFSSDGLARPTRQGRATLAGVKILLKKALSCAKVVARPGQAPQKIGKGEKGH